MKTTWKKRNDTLILVRLKVEAVFYTSRGVDTSIIAEMVDRTERKIKEWLSSWGRNRLHSVVTGYAGNQNTARLILAQKERFKEVLSKPPSQSCVKVNFWNVPVMRDVVRILFDVEYQSDFFYQLLLRFCGMSPRLLDPFDKRRDKAVITERMAQVRAQSADLLAQSSPELGGLHPSTWSGGCGSSEAREQSCTWTGERRPSHSSMLVPNKQEDEDTPSKKPEHRTGHPGHGLAPTRDQQRPDSSRPGQRRLPPRQGPQGHAGIRRPAGEP